MRVLNDVQEGKKMTQLKVRSIRLTISEQVYDEFKVLEIRAKRSAHDLIVDVLEKYIDKKKEKVSNAD